MKNINLFWIKWQQDVSKKLGVAPQKAGKESDTKKINYGNILELIRLIVDSFFVVVFLLHN